MLGSAPEMCRFVLLLSIRAALASPESCGVLGGLLFMMKLKAVSGCWHRAWCDSRASSEAGSELPSVRSQLCGCGFVCECKMIHFAQSFAMQMSVIRTGSDLPSIWMS